MKKRNRFRVEPWNKKTKGARLHSEPAPARLQSSVVQLTHVMFVAYLPHSLEVAVLWYYHSVLTLDGLGHERCRVRV